MENAPVTGAAAEVAAPLVQPAAPKPPVVDASDGAFRRRPAVVAAALVLALVLLALVGVGWRSGFLFGTGEPAGMVFVIPAGAKERIELPAIDSAIPVPTKIRFAAGEPAVITIRNLDDVTHRAGPWVVGPYQTYTQRFPEPGVYPIACAVDPLESVTVTVEG
jgi:hypothetical protein